MFIKAAWEYKICAQQKLCGDELSQFNTSFRKTLKVQV